MVIQGVTCLNCAGLLPQEVPLVEQELIILPQHLNSSQFVFRCKQKITFTGQLHFTKRGLKTLSLFHSATFYRRSCTKPEKLIGHVCVATVSDILLLDLELL
jgi:hypothetical protein